MTARTEPNPAHTDYFLSAFSDELFEEMRRSNDPETGHYSVSGRSKLNPDGENAAWWLEHGPGMVAEWQTWREKVGWPIWVMPDGQPGIELDILAEVDGWPVKAIIDRVFNVNGVPVILDLKSGKREPKDLLQLGVYRCAIQAKYGLTIDQGTYWMARTGQITPIYDIRKYTPALLSEYIREYAAGVENRVFLPHVSSLCPSCAMRKFCHAFGGESAEIDPDYERSQ